MRVRVPPWAFQAITGLQRNEGFAKSAVLGQLTLKLTLQIAFFDFCLPILERCNLGRRDCSVPLGCLRLVGFIGQVTERR